MHKLAKVVLEGYREWTESLGDDREWLIQRTQSEIEKTASEAAKEVGAFYLPTRKDVLIFILNGIENPELIFESLERVSPVPIRVEIGCGKTPLEALRGKPCKETGPIAALHVDINSFRSKDYYLGYVESIQLFESLLKVGLGFGAVGGYLGGDNVLLFADPSDAQSLGSTICTMFDVKVGIGIASTARESLALAARALRRLRENRERRLEVIEGR